MGSVHIIRTSAASLADCNLDKPTLNLHMGETVTPTVPLHIFTCVQETVFDLFHGGGW